jgi:uncharacterized protein YfiM (DUF2279 family)
MAVSSTHPNQHAYQSGNCTETALHQLVLDQKETAFGFFFIYRASLTTPTTTTMPHWSEMESILTLYEWPDLRWRFNRLLQLLGVLQERWPGAVHRDVYFPLLLSLIVDLIIGLKG